MKIKFIVTFLLATISVLGADDSQSGSPYRIGKRKDLPKAADGYRWREFSQEGVILQIPDGWSCYEKDLKPARLLIVSPDRDVNGKYDTGFTLNTVFCHSEKEWNDAYLSSLKLWQDTTKEIEALGKPTFQKVVQTKDKSMQVFVVEGDVFLPNAPHPQEKYRTRTYVRAIPGKGLVFVYTIGGLAKDWDKVWMICDHMLEPIVFSIPEDEPNQRPERNAGATSPSTSTPPAGVAHP